MSTSLQERTLVVKGYDPDKTTKEILEELFIQGGPVRNIVFRPDHSFVEYEDKESVGYALALFKGLELFKRPLIIEPKLNEPSNFKFLQHLDLVYNSLMMERNLAANIIQPTMTPRHTIFNPPQFINQPNHQHQAMFANTSMQHQQSLLPGTSNFNTHHQGGSFVTMDPDRVFYPQTSPPSNRNNNNNNYNRNNHNNSYHRPNNYNRPRPHNNRHKRWSN